MKTRKGKKMIPEQMQGQVDKLKKWKDAGLDYALSLSNAADSGYQGLVEPKPISRQAGIIEGYSALTSNNIAASINWLNENETENVNVI